MAKRPTTTVTPAEARANADALIRFHALGADSLTACPPAHLRGDNPKRLGDELGRMQKVIAAEKLTVRVNNLATLTKMRRVAAEYKTRAIQQLATAVRRHRSRFSTSHLIRVLAVRSRKARAAITAKAVEQSWTTAELDLAVQIKRRKRRPGVGRKPRVPQTRAQLLVELEGMTMTWLRWTEAAPTARLAEDTKAAIERANAAVTELAGEVAKNLKRIPAVIAEEAPQPAARTDRTPGTRRR